jgi:hypothetical protein
MELGSSLDGEHVARAALMVSLPRRSWDSRRLHRTSCSSRRLGRELAPRSEQSRMISREGESQVSRNPCASELTLGV